MSRWLERIQANTLNGSAKNIHQHYDLTTEFYKLWLDPQLLYSCAYFSTPSTTLEEAQLSKMDYICRKLQLKPSDKVVEIGSGWGALALHMAKHYGATVKGFNISKEQIAFARERAKRENLGRQVEFVEEDYRHIAGQYDAVVSIGMLEHVGAEYYKDFGRIVHRCIGDSGRGLIQSIGRNQLCPFSPWIRARIFPGAFAPTIRQIMGIFEPWDFSVLDVENLREHYAKTLEHWLNRFEDSVDRVHKIFGSEFVRAWRLYLWIYSCLPGGQSPIISNRFCGIKMPAHSMDACPPLCRIATSSKGTEMDSCEVLIVGVGQPVHPVLGNWGEGIRPAVESRLLAGDVILSPTGGYT